jgi:hypothetical protein
VDAERARLRAVAGLVQIQQQFKRPEERLFTAAERGKVTILVGGMSWKRDDMFRVKCGHDAPIDGVIEGIIEKSHTPYFSFKGLDETKPTGSVGIRVQTIDYFLHRYPPRHHQARARRAPD